MLRAATGDSDTSVIEALSNLDLTHLSSFRWNEKKPRIFRKCFRRSVRDINLRASPSPKFTSRTATGDFSSVFRFGWKGWRTATGCPSFATAFPGVHQAIAEAHLFNLFGEPTKKLVATYRCVRDKNKEASPSPSFSSRTATDGVVSNPSD